MAPRWPRGCIRRSAGWAVSRDKSLSGEYDAAHMLTPMPLAISLGAGSTSVPWTMPAVENINGQAITLSMKHKDKNHPSQWKGFKFAVPFDGLVIFSTNLRPQDIMDGAMLRRIPYNFFVGNPSEEEMKQIYQRVCADFGLTPEGQHYLVMELLDGEPLSEVIAREDYGRLLEFDALFIRATTAVNHYTYRFARRAAAEGLVVIDDPLSILRCTNKVYLYELFGRHGVPMPCTRIVLQSQPSAPSVAR